MNQQGVSEVCFEETYAVSHDQTARSLFARLPHGREYARTLIECLATGYLVAVVESICVREMQMHVDPIVEVVVGRTVHIEHLGPIPPTTRLRLRGWVEGLGERSATFHVQAHDDHELVFDGTVTLVAADRPIGRASSRALPRRSVRSRRPATGSGSDRRERQSSSVTDNCRAVNL